MQKAKVRGSEDTIAIEHVALASVRADGSEVEVSAALTTRARLPVRRAPRRHRCSRASAIGAKRPSFAPVSCTVPPRRAQDGPPGKLRVSSVVVEVLRSPPCRTMAASRTADSNTRSMQQPGCSYLGSWNEG